MWKNVNIYVYIYIYIVSLCILIAQLWYLYLFHDLPRGEPTSSSSSHVTSDQKLQPVPLSLQARFWPHQVGPGDRNRPKCWMGTILNSHWHLLNTNHDRIISILVLTIGFSKLCNPWSLLTVYYFQAVFRYLWATWLPLPTTQSRNCSNEYEWFVATSLFQSPCVSRVCLRMSLKSSHPIALAASMYTCSWAMSAKRIASWKANSCCTFTSTRPSLSQLHGLSSSMTNDLLVQSTLDLWWMQQWKNNEASCHSSRFAKGCKEVNAAPYLISILKCHQNYSAKNSSGFNGVYQQSTEQDVGCGQSLW